VLTGRWSAADPGQKERLSGVLRDERSLTIRAVRQPSRATGDESSPP
jgi:hypothetical protein